MRIARCSYGDSIAWCVVTDEEVRLLDGVAEFSQALAVGPASKSRPVPIDKVRWLPPVQASTKIICAGINYARHAAEMRRQTAAYPSMFVRFADSFVGHDEAVVQPWVTESFDYEAELAVVIGRAGRHISEHAAMEYVGGYTCMAENSVRDFQKHNAQVTPGKNFDRSGSMGPWITTSDTVTDPRALQVAGRLNGAVVQKASVDELITPIARLIAYVSTFTALRPGDVIATGTPDGVGASKSPPRFLQPGDVFEVEIDGVGRLRNRVEREQGR